MARKLTQEEFERRLKAANPDIIPLGKYVGLQHDVLVQSRTCGHRWRARPDNLINAKSGCPECKGKKISDKLRKTHEKFVSELKEVNDTIEVVGEYEGDGEPVRVRCLVCGHRWKSQPNHLLQGHGCGRCNHTSTSFMEQYLLHSLIWACGESRVISRDKDVMGFELDILLPTMRPAAAIEIGSWRFHADSFDRDIEKRRACEAAGIRLFSIYDQYDEFEQPFEDDCFVFAHCLGQENGHETLRSLVASLHGELGLGIPSPADFEAIEREAIEGSRRTTTEDFIEEMARINPDIEITGEYIRSNKKIGCRCRVEGCGHAWEATPANLRQGHGCGKCASRKRGADSRLSAEEFERRVKEANPHLEIVGEYRGTHEAIEMLCIIHKKRFSITAGKLFVRRGCSECKRENLSRIRKHTHEQFSERLAQVNPNIEPIGTYMGDGERIDVRCRLCGREWSAVAGVLLQGRGCRECAKKSRGDKLRWTQERFDEELSRKHPTIKRLGEYVGANKRVLVRCEICGEEWTPNAYYLIDRAPGCPKRKEHPHP